MKWKNMLALTVILSISATLLFTSGCTEEEVIETSEQVSTIAGRLLVVTPPAAAPFLALIGALASTVGASVAALSQFKKARKMKKAIIAKADQIDKVIIATKGNPSPDKQPVLDFLKADMRLANGDRLKSLNDFDGVRKGLM